MRLLKAWTSQPPFPAAINSTYLPYRPRFILTPSVFFDYLGGVQPSLANDANRRPDSYNFPGVNGYIDTGSTSRVTQDAHSILVVCKLASFVSAYPAIASYKTSSSRMQLFYSNNAAGGYTDLCWGTDGTGGTKSRWSLSAFGSVTGTRHQLVVTRGPGVVQKGWCNGVALSSTTPGSFGTNTGNSVLGQASTSDLSTDFAGDIYLYVEFDGVIPDVLARSLSANPYHLFAPRQIILPAQTAASGTASITAAAGTATASTLAGSSTAATTVTAAAGAATASSMAGASTAVASFTQADGVATAATLQGSSDSSTITQADGIATAATMVGSSVAVSAFTSADGVATAYTLIGSDAAEPTLIGRKRPRRRRQLPAEIPANKLPEILEKVSEEKDYLNEALAEANTELTIAALSTDNSQRRAEKLRTIGLDIARLEMEIAEAEDEEAFLMLVMQAARTMI